MHVLVGGVTSAVCLVVSKVWSDAIAGGVVAPGLVRWTRSCSVVWAEVAAGGDVVAGTEGFWVEIR